jgi:LacI family transcriptional regulator
MKVKLTDIARRAGVGHATVDRVLNERGGVTPETARLVLNAARELGFDRALPIPYRKGLRFEILLGRKEIQLCSRIGEAFEKFVWPFGGSVTIERTFVDDRKPDRVAAAIRKSRGNAIIVYGQENDLVVEAIAEATSAGKPVVTLVSDVPTAPRLSYVGIDHYSAGRTAAFFMSRMSRDGDVAVVCSDVRYRADAERVSGFRDGLAEYSSSLAVASLIEGRDDIRLTGDLLCRALSTGACVGLYSAGTVNAAIEEAVLGVGGGRPVVIGHDLTLDARRMLQSGVMTLVIDQNPELQVKKALQILAVRFGFSAEPTDNPPVPFTLHVRDNL